MKKIILAIITCCFVASMARAQQISLEAQLSENKPLEMAVIPDHNDVEHGRIFVKINGEPDDQGRTPVQIELENNSDDYDFLLFDRAWTKRQLRKNWRIFFAKGFSGESTLAVEHIDLNGNQSNNILRHTGERYTFPEILVEEGETYECKIPIHLAKPKPNFFCRKKKVLYGIVECNISISVDNRDRVYEKLERECDSLLLALDDALMHKKFCTHRKHRPSFEEQTEEFTMGKLRLKNRINSHLSNKGWPTESKKYKQYKALLDSLDAVDQKLAEYKHDCRKHGIHNCRYCKLSLREIYYKLEGYYRGLYNGEVKKDDILLKEVKLIYKCCTDPTCATHAQQWANGDPYRAGIEEYYDKIISF